MDYKHWGWETKSSLQSKKLLEIFEVSNIIIDNQS